MKEGIRIMKSSDGLNKEKGKTTEIWVRIVEMHSIKKIITSIKRLALAKKRMKTMA